MNVVFTKHARIALFVLPALLPISLAAQQGASTRPTKAAASKAPVNPSKAAPAKKKPAPAKKVAASSPKPKLAPKTPSKAPSSPKPSGSGNGAPASEGVKFFTDSVRPILERSCIPCHSGAHAQGKLQLTSREGILKGGLKGPSVSLDQPEKSLLLSAINHQGMQMPPGGKLPQKEIEAITRWVKMGMPWPGAKSGAEEEPHHGPPQVTAKTKQFWSFRSIRRPAVPAVKKATWVKNPIDAFVLKRLESEGLSPNPPVGRAALLRRATYDLTGLSPTPEEVRAFLADTSPNAYEKVVDRLLASPRYGEKWGRHWLDLVRYAETNSYERDSAKPNAWKYRDYVIQSFNEDKPYDRFVTEQLAGDELEERTPEGLIATGYYRLGIWDDEPSDTKQALYDDLDDIVANAGQVFLGMTINCARCHDHKLDPIPQKDYYSFLAFFNGVQRYGGPDNGMFGGRDLRFSQRPLAPKAEQERHRAAIEAHRAKMKANTDSIEALEKRLMEDLAPVEKEEFKTDAARIAIFQKRVPRLYSPEEFDLYKSLLEERDRLDREKPKAMETALAVTETGPEPRETYLLQRGSPHAPGEKVEPGFPSILSPPAPKIVPPVHGDTSGRRMALARWMTGKENPLSARVMANRIWQYHFGRGIVRSSNDFGFQGDRPTHPDLLDWLASEFIAKGWRMKPLHRMIMLSSAYRMSSGTNAAALAKDPENDLFWRFDMRRLTAEELRDSIYAVNGGLNTQMGGPSVFTTIPEEVLAGQSRPGEGWGKSPPEQERRRSIYIFAKRSLTTPILASFDGPETDFSCPVRFTSTQPTQALGMLNSDFLQEQAKAFAGYLRREAGEKPAAQVELALWRTLQRKPTPGEIERGVRLIETMRREENLSEEDALASFSLIALNLNEFIYLD